MGIGTGIGMVLAGAILYWALEMDLPYVDGNALGVILMVAGVLAVGAALATNTDRLEPGVGAGIGLVVGGAILFCAVDIDLPYVVEGALAVILMVAGLIAVVVTVVMDVMHKRARHPVEHRIWRRPRDEHH